MGAPIPTRAASTPARALIVPGRQAYKSAPRLAGRRSRPDPRALAAPAAAHKRLAYGNAWNVNFNNGNVNTNNVNNSNNVRCVR
jgi:hypothetical protein